MVRTILFIAFVLLLLPAVVPAQAPPLVDLAAQPAKPWNKSSISEIGTVSGGCFDCPPTREPKLPLDIRLESIEPIAEPSGERLVSMLIRNVGSTPYSLPIGRDPDVLKPGNHGRREFWFDLKLAGERYGYLNGQETYGSTDMPDTFMTIPPKAIVRVRFKIDVADALKHTATFWQKELPAATEVQAAVVDALYDDNPLQYVVHLPHLDAVSEGKLLVRLAKDAMPGQPEKQ